MALQITGKIIAALPHRSGVSQRTGNPWEIGEFVLETHEQYPKKCLFQISGPDRLKNINLQQGEEVTVSIDIDAHESNGRWYNSISAYRVDRVQQGAQQPAPQTQAAPAQAAPQQTQPAPQAQGSDGLPF